MSNFTNWLSENGSPSRLLLPPNNLRDSLTSLFSVQGKRSRQVLSVAFTVLMAVFFSQSSFAQELLVNPGFESKLTGWQSSKSPIRTIAATNPIHSGTYAAHINANYQDNEYFFQNVNATPLATYTFSVWAMVHDILKYSAVGVNVYDANWVKIPASSFELQVNCISFQKFTKTFSVASNAKYLQVFGYTDWTVLKVDDYSLTQACNNVTSGGTIAANQSGVSGFDPATFTSVANPSGGSTNALEIVWLKSTTATTLTTANASQWTTIQGATGLTYDSGPLTQTTSFIRCSRRAGCTDYVGESNVLTVTVSTDLCTSFTVSGVNTNATTNGGTNGAVNVTVAGGKSPFVYSWSNGATTEDLTGLKAGIYWLTVTDANKCVKTYQAVITQPNGACIGFRTQTQGGWGSKANGENPGAYRDANFAAAFPSGVTVGCGTKLLKLTTTKAVEDFLPSGSTPSVLPAGTLTNPAGTYSNVLAGQVVALTLNIGFDNYDATFGSSSTNLKNLFITTGTFSGKSVQFLLDEANKALGGCSTTYSLSDINNAVTSVNENYVNGTSTGDFLGCCNNVTSGGIIAANQTGCSGFDPAAFTSVADPSGGSTNPLEIVWLKSTTSSVLTTATASQWTTISGATGLTYDAGPLTQTTYFIRCSRRAGCTDYVGESNVITVTISGNCGGKDPVCLSRKTPVLSNLLCGAGTTNYGLFFEDLKGNVASPSQYFTVKSGELTEFCDGTAVLNYTACVNGGGANDCINVAVNFSGRTGTPPTGSPVSNTHCTTYSPNVSDWYYYPTSSGAFSGTGIYAGLAGGYTQNMAAFQIGTGGGLNEITKFGASSWFKINITNGGTNNWSTVSTKGDINVNLGALTTLASVTATANPTSICKGGSVVLTATIDAASKSANCSPTYSWVGSNGFTSTQATVTNTNVQGATTYTVTVTFTAANGSKCSVTATTGVTLNAVCCDNVTNGGQIATSQSGCAPFDPAPFTEVTAPSGGSGAAEFLWLKSTTTTVFTSANSTTDWFQVLGANGATLDVGPLSKTTAYIRCSRRAGCSDYIGESNVIIITVNPSPSAPTVTGAAFCGTSTATLTATCATGSTPNWYTALTGGTAIATGTSYTTPSISSATSYYVTCKSTAGCESTPRVEVKLTVNPNPPVPTVTPATSCGPGSITLGAVCGTGSTANWYAAATGGSSIATGANYTTVSLSASTTYYVSCKTDLGCESSRVEVKATVIAKITDGGKIQSDENICPGKTPTLITSVTPASGGDANLAIEYIWLQTTSLSANGTCPLNIVGQNLYTQIPGANQTDYQPGAITQSTCYIRCARRAGCTDYIGGESNTVKKTLLINCQGKDPICLSRKTPVLNTVECNSAVNYGLFFNDLKGNVATPSTLYSVKSGEFTEFCNGTAVLSYVACVNGGGANDCITTTVNFSGRTATPPAGSPVSNTHCSNYMPNVSDWYYYPVSNGTFSGTGIYAGLAGTYAQNMAAFQVGTGGGLNELIKFGGSSWFKINITNGGTNNWTTASKEGDININLGSSTTIASVTATANPTAICSGESVNLTATVDAASKSANCSPSYSWVGSNGFTSTQATVTNTNVTASTTYTVTVTFTAVNGSKCSVTATTGVTVNPTPATPTVTPASICGTGTVTLGATCATGATAQWYTTATGGTAIATGPSYTTPSISANTSYYVSCKSPEGCLSARVEVKATVNANGVTPTVKPTAICGTGTVTLGATCSTGSTAQWYTASTGGTVIATGTSYTTLSITATTSYYVSCKTPEGCESARAEVKATINPIPNAPTGTPAAICGTGTVTLGATCTTGTAQWYAAATGGNSIATGASYTTPSISAMTSYYVSCKTTEGCESARAEVKATINPIPVPPVAIKNGAICGTGTVELGAICTAGTAQWYAAATGGNSIATGLTYTTPSISATTLYYVSCKTTEGCESGRIEVKATINPIPNAPTVTPAAICGTGTVTLGATCTTGVAQWYAATTGGNSIATGTSYTTPSISATTSYYVSCKTTEGCESGRVEVKATINPIPTPPVAIKNGAICGTGTVELGAICTAGTAQWYAATTGGNSIATGASYTTPSISATTSYYVSCKTTEGCESGRVEVKATINPIPTPPVAIKNGAICGTGTVELGAICTAGTAQWYAAATGGNSIATGATFTTPSISATTSYYVSCKTTEGCESGRIEVKATINPIPNAPTVTPAAICGTGTVTLGATCATGTAQWYAAATGGNSIATGATFTTPSISATTSYYVSCKTTEGCESGRIEVKATINQIPNAPTVTPAAICGTGTVTLGATCATGTAQWYAAATGGNSIATGLTYTTPSISATTSYYVSCKTTEGCESGRIEVKATINPIPNAPTVTPAAICGTGTVTLGATCTTGVAQWYAATTGGNSIATGASYTTTSISATTSYYVSCKTTEGCESGRIEVKATTNGTPTAPTVTPATNCGNGFVTLGAACSAGTPTWYVAATGGNAIASGTSYTTPTLSTTTSYYVSCKSSTGCESSRTEVKATVIGKITDGGTIKADEVICVGATPSKITSVTPASGGDASLAIEYIWLKTTSLTSTGACPANIAGQNLYTVIPGSTSAEYQPGAITQTTCYIRCARRAGCTDYEGESNAVKKSTEATAAAPTVTPAAICGTGTVTLGATCTTGIANWYAAATGGNSIATGASFTTPTISATTSYYVSCKSANAGCESARREVKATINPIPAAPTVTPAAICGTGTVTLGATCTTGTAQWYAAATGGSVITTGASYTTPSLSTTTSYYVSCKSAEGCESGRIEVKATINSGGTPPTVTPAAICGTGTVTLGATCTTGVAQWYAAATGGNSIATGASYTTPTLSATTSYYVSCKSSAGCESGRIEVKATINPIPNAPTVTPAAICGTGTVILGATCTTGIAQWYAAATGGSVLTTGASYTTPSISATTSYYVSCKSSAGCESGRTEVKASINAGGTAPTVTPATSCGTGSVTLGATCTTGTATWYAAATGGNAIATGASYTTPSISTTTSYYVSCKSSAGCESSRIEVKATIIAKITDGGTIQADETICGSGTPAKITSVTPASGGDANVAIEYIWLKTTSLTSTGTCPANVAGQNLYTVIPGSTSADYQPGAITQTTCYIRCARRAGCTDYEGESNAVKKTITNLFTITATANPTSTCAGGTVNITTTTTATGTVTYTWKGPDGFTASTKDVTLANVTLAKGGVYTVTVSNGSCSAVGTVQVTVTNCLKLGDTVFNDKNNNGKQDAGEPNIPGVTVKLYNSANILVATTTTDAITGKYLFSNLAPGDYTVEIVAPAGYKSSTGTNGSATGAYEPAGSPNNNVDGDDNGTTVSGQTIRSLPVTLTVVGGDNLTIDFGLFKPASIGDYVFRDLNGDGKQDAGEGGVNGVTVKLYDSANNLVATKTTGPDGKYLFDNLIAGSYTVEFVKSTLASGFNFSPAGTTTPDKDSDANVTTGKTGTITLTEGQNRTDIDAGVTTPCDNDKTPPVLTACPMDILIKTRGTYAYASWTEPTATDNCGTPIVTTTNASGSAFPVGSTTVTYTATDAKGNKVTCSFVVNVVKIITCDVDTQAPVFYDCPTDISVSFLYGTKAIVNWDHPSVGDNCGIPSVTYNFEPGQEFPFGTTEVIYTAKDAKGNTSYCKFKITVNFYLVLKTNPATTPVPTGRVAAASSQNEEVSLENQITLYPNPTNTDFAVELSAELMRANSSVEVKVIGTNGNSYFSETAAGKESVSMKVSVETMPSGTYFVNVGLDNGRMIIKKLQIIK